ncbi:hypothetical protein CBI38_24990 [Rhodococcus oxybenzonivorans]|uniref:Integral membrane protein n=1 Tax=Rhodococcus oxybenzonivorans TaxID=1990687 RepID=A0A2S2C0B2_9NOCA|nr:hypothetical protein [Rhodococcus oxybenzonivorans]AWK74327.1 hypothetical protein CBI38_24990 [Rhodococcus oxybenzonivorans]
MTDGTGTPASSSLDNDERAELLRLREEVAALRGHTTGTTTDIPARTVPRPPRHGLRWTAVAILLVLVAVLAIASVTARFTRSQILDTDRYVSTVAPLGDDPAVQAEISNQVTDEIFTRVDVEGLTKDALTALTDVSILATNAPRLDKAVVGLAPVLTSQARNFVHDTVSSLVQSQQFEDLWIQANRSAHVRLVAVMTGNYGLSSVEVDQTGTVSISLGTVIDRVKAALNERGFAFADKIPSVDKQFVLFQSPELVKAQRAVSALDKVSAILPWLGIACAAAAVAVAPTGRRLRALALVGLSIAVGMLILAIAILIGRAIYLDSVPPDILSPDAATAVIDTVLVPLRTSLRAVAVLGLVIALGAYLIGGSSSAATVRRGYGQALDFARRSGKSGPPNEIERWAHQLRVPLRCAIIGVAALLLMFWRYPTGLVVLWIVLGALLALAVLELVIRPARTATPQNTESTSAASP